LIDKVRIQGGIIRKREGKILRGRPEGRADFQTSVRVVWSLLPPPTSC
jgi:hypothetical protein